MKEVQLHDEDLKKAILELPYSNCIGIDGEGILIPESDYGFAEIYRMYDDIIVFMIPTYGGTPSFFKCVGRHAIDYLIKELRDIT